MDEKAKAARRAYKRAWAQKNPEKIKAQQERYWTKKATQAEQEPEHKEDPTNAEAIVRAEALAATEEE